MSDLVFHLLDIQARDMRIESEQEDVVEVSYDSHSDEDDEIQTRRQNKKTATSGSQRQFIIHLFGATETGQPLRCDVTGFRPTMYLRLPEEKTSATASSIQKHIRDQLTRQRLSFTDLTFTRITKKIFYGFTAQTFYPFLQIDVPSISLFRTLRSMFLDEFMNPTMFLDDNVNIVTKRPDAPPPRGKKIEIFEANLDPMLRFLHVQNIQPCGWVRVKDGKKSITSDQGRSLVVECDYEQIVPTQGPRVSAPFLTASWDIECFSRTGDFPVAKRTWRKAAKELLALAKSSDDVIAFVTNSMCTPDLNPPASLTKGMTTIYATYKKGMTLERVHMELTKSADSFDAVLKMAGDSQEAMEELLGKTLNRIVTLTGDPVIQIGTTLTRGTVDTTERHLFVFPDCADIPGIEVHAYPTEELMIVAWFDWMIERDPDILIGYNVFGFDESYLWARAEELKLVKETAAFHAMNRLMELSGELKLEEKFLSSSAMGDNRMYIWTTQGRLQVDLFHYIKRNNVLPSYKLDEVTKHFMSGKLKKQSYDAVTRQLRLEVAGAIKDVRAGRAITLLDETGETVSEKLMIDSVDGNVLLMTCDLDDDALIEMEDATKWVVVKDDVSPQDIFRLHRGSAEDRAVVGKYCLPEDEHQILTNRGYMYLHELLQLWGDDINSPPATTDLLLAGFNSDTKQLVYERPNRLILNDYCVDQDMVEFTQHSYSDRWDKDNMFGLTEQQRCTIQSVEKEDTEYRTPNFVSLITTPGHDMYARCGFVTGDKNQYPRMTTGKGRTPIPYKKIKSKDLLGKGTPKIIKLMGRVENGIVSDEVHSIPYPFTSECNLKITTREQQIAFLELYGYWLGDGSILIKRGKPESITFNIVKKSDAEWLEKTFQILDIHDRSSYKNSKEYEMPDVSDGVYKIPRQTQYVIKIFDEAYKKFFFDEYLIKYMKTDASSDRVKDFADVAKMINRNTCESTINTDATLHLSNNTEIEEIKSAKWLMNWVWGLSKDSARAIINGIVLADGSHHKGKALKHIFTSSTRFRDEVERLAFHAGYAPYSTVCYLAGSVRGQSADGKPVTANHTLWSVNFPENEQFSEPTLKREENDIKYVKYTGRTWCVSMPTTFIVARRARCVNGIVSHASRPLVIGNCLQDCDLVIDLYKKLETFNNSMSMANVCSVPVSYIFTRGQGIKIESLMFKCCRERNVLIPVLPAPTQGGDDSYEGAIVLDPQPGFYSTSPIGVCDFASLYPSTIVSENISHDSLLWVKDFTNEGELIAHQWGSEVYDECDGYAFTDIEYDIIRSDPSDTRKHPRKIKCGRRICRFAQPLDGTKSTLPQITTWLLTARSAKKKEMKAEKDPERYALLDAEQLAYKLTGNSLYGQLGSGTFKIRLQALAASVTAYGRKQILYAKAAIEKFYGPEKKLKHCAANVMYGDTDSLFVEFNVRNPETGERLTGREARVATIEMTDEAGALITKTLAAPHDFEFDKAFDPLLMFSKKRYAGNMYEENPDDYVHKYMGIALKRRDNAPIVKTIFGGAMKMLLDKRDVVGAFQFVKEKCLELVDGKVNLGQLTVTKSLRADYADPARIAHKALADRITMRDPGNAPAAGDRIGYVYIRPSHGKEASKLQGERIETPQFIKDHQLVPDYRHYIEHQLQNPISQAFGLLLEQIPGFQKDMIRSCPAVTEDLDKYLAFREAKAAELLFYDCLHSESITKLETDHKKSVVRSAFTSLFGGNIVISKAVSTVTSAATTTATVKSVTNGDKPVTRSAAKQTTMSSFLLDSMIVDGIKKKNQAKDAAATRAANKKAKEESAKEESA